MLDALTYPAAEEAPTGELDEYLVALMEQLKPREQVVIQLRFGLAGKECHSLSQVSEVLDVSKERDPPDPGRCFAEAAESGPGKGLL